MMLQLLTAKLGSFSLYVQNWVQEAQHFPDFVNNFPNINVSDFDTEIAEEKAEESNDLQV